MKPVTTFSLAVVLSSVLATPGFAAVSGEQAREANAHNQTEPSSQTTTPWSSSMSSANTPSHDGNSQLGTNQRKAPTRSVGREPRASHLRPCVQSTHRATMAIANSVSGTVPIRLQRTPAVAGRADPWQGSQPLGCLAEPISRR